jgi:FkbM family methyltransferase
MFKLPIDMLSDYRMRVLRDKGFRPRTILDVGAYKGKWSEEMKKIFTDSSFFLVEGNTDCRPFLQASGFPFCIAMLSDERKFTYYYNHTGNDKTGNSLYRERTTAYVDSNCTVEKVDCDTLDAVVKRHTLEDIDFIKIDVQGSEKDVIMGGLDVVRNAKIILLELQLVEYNTGAPLIAEMIQFMDSIGFQMTDVTELHYTPNHTLLQIDVLFIRKDLVNKDELYV